MKRVQTTKHIRVQGVVQGVGFRPFIYGLATQLDLHGWVRNTSEGVEIVVQGQTAQVERMLHSLASDAPPLAKIDLIDVHDEVAEEDFIRFEIRPSNAFEGAIQPIAPDVALCADCARELFDPNDRRYLYPFINCTNCGPRYTIITDLPYDRPATTMADFPMCEACRIEYQNPLDRRFHAQPVACPNCGPLVQLREKPASLTSTLAHIDLRLPALIKARRLLREGKILAIKGLGGFHLACDAGNLEAVDELRRRKGRAGKPFALMMTDLNVVTRYCEVNEAEQALLNSREKPIVLLRKKTHTNLPREVAPGMDTLGVMLPYTPLHHLLLNQSDATLAREPAPQVLVMTSGNFSEEPIALTNEEALERLAPLADVFLLHNREIHIRCDDSVVRVDAADETSAPETVFLRRARGYAPYPIHLPFKTIPTLAVGGELKNTFCLTRDSYGFLSQHIGDMENAEVYASFEHSLTHLSRLFRIQPELLAHDLHPGYFTTRYAESIQHIPRIGVQHHHAHIAAVMAEHGIEDGNVIGLVFDGTGYGSDGKIWGGEFLLASYADFERVAHLEYLPLPGGDSATRHPWRIAVGYAEALGIDIEGLPFLAHEDPQAVDIVRKQVQKKLNAPESSSMGRLFDAVASMVGIRNEVSYEAQAAMELEVQAKAWLTEVTPYPFDVQGNVIRLGGLFQHIVDDVRASRPAGYIGARFHWMLADLAEMICQQTSKSTGIRTVALSGGVWQNQVLLSLTRKALLQHDFNVLMHRLTPANDGGLALGQAVIANFKYKNGGQHVP